MINRSEAELLDCDVVVVGGGVAGLSAAISAARSGARTTIIQDRPVYGGNSSSEIRVVPHGAASGNAWACETGLFHEVLLTDRATNPETFIDQGTTNSHYDLTLQDFVRSEPLITELRNTTVRAVEVAADGRTIRRVLGSQLGSEREFSVGADVIVDATGDATVAHLAGAGTRYGRESRAEHDERLAPLEADRSTLGSTITLKARRTDQPVPFVRPPWAYDYSSPTALIADRALHRIGGDTYGGFWWLEVNDPFDQIHDNQRIRDELHRHVFGVWDYVKNHSPLAEEAAPFVLEWVGQIPGKRESRRVVGDVVLTEHDVRHDPHWSDAIGYGGWWIDLHVKGGVNNRSEPAERENVDQHYSAFVRVAPFSIPLRACYSSDIDNLFVAGRSLSATHIGLSAVRVQLTLGALGQAVGVAAARCVQQRRSPRDLAADPSAVWELQQDLLRADLRLLGIRNDDPDDLARRAKVSASSTLAVAELGGGNQVNWLELDSARGQVMPPATDGVRSLALHLHSDLDRAAQVQVALELLDRLWDREPGPPVWSSTLDVPPRFTGWLEVPVGRTEPLSTSWRIGVAGEPGLQWAGSAEALTGTVAQYRIVTPSGPEPRNAHLASLSSSEVDLPPVDAWRQHRRFTHAVRVDPPLRPFGPEQVTNGCAWPEHGPNLWISDPAAGLPQWLELAWDEEVAVRELEVRFDTNLDLRTDERPGLGRTPETVSDWQIEAEVSGQWQQVFAERGNWGRQRYARFPTVRTRRLRLMVTGTNGDPSARVYEVRVHG